MSRTPANSPAALVTLLDPPPDPTTLPARFASPFAQDLPPPVARRAAETLAADLRNHALARELDRPGGGKMVGVLVVATGDGQIGFLRGFSGMLGGQWSVAGFVPAVFDAAALARFWPDGEAELAEIDRGLRDLTVGAAAVAARSQLQAMRDRHAAEVAALASVHRAKRNARHAARQVLGGTTNAPATESALAQESRADAGAARRLTQSHTEERRTLSARVLALDDERTRLRLARAARSQTLQAQIHATYPIANARGERRALADLFAPHAPPSGAGDCAAPKLLHFAYRHHLRPVALAEFWWGAPPAGGGRSAGAFYPACRGKCGPILTHMLEGLPCDPAPVFGGLAIDDDEPRVVFEDQWLVVVDKPSGMLSVPGRSGALRDSVLVRLRRRYPAAQGPLVVHRLDLDTSGLVLAAKDAGTHAALQAQFARREVTKRYIAWVDGRVSGDSGEITLPLRGDLDDRPRQVVDVVGGRAAVTTWRVLDRTTDRTRVALWPQTGRTHQLRVHAAHPHGLAAAIVGDRLYGRSAERLLLHAEALEFVHPHTKMHIRSERPAPF